MKVNVRSKIRFNGQEYSSPDELPEAARAAYERAITGTIATTGSGLKTRLVFNGQQFSSPAEMPASEKKLYDDAMQLVRDSGKSMSAAPEPSVADTGWLTKQQVQLIAMVAGFLLAAAIMLAVFKN